MKTDNKAARAYQEAQAEVQGLLNEVSQHLSAHARRQAADPRNYGFVGDLKHYAQLLKQVIGFSAKVDLENREVTVIRHEDGKGLVLTFNELPLKGSVTLEEAAIAQAKLTDESCWG
jgi:hypothetical protein